MNKRKKLLYGEKFDIESFADLLAMMAIDEESFSLLEQTTINLLISKRTNKGDILTLKSIMQKIKVNAVRNLLYDIDNENTDTALELIKQEGERVETILKRAKIGLFEVLLEVSRKMFMFTNERWFIMQVEKKFTVYLVYIGYIGADDNSDFEF